MSEPYAAYASAKAPGAGLKRFIVRLTELDVWELRVDAVDGASAERFARDCFTSSLGAKADFEHVDGGIDHVESEELPPEGGQP